MYNDLDTEDQVRIDAFLASHTGNDLSMTRAIRDVVFDDRGIRPTAVEYGVPRSNLERNARSFRNAYAAYMERMGRFPPLKSTG